MNSIPVYRPRITGLFLMGIFCLGLIWTEVEDLRNDRELAIVRRHIPAAFIHNSEIDSVQMGSTLFDGDTLVTDEQGYALVMFMDQSVTRVRPGSQLIVRGTVNEDRSMSTRINVNLGEIFLNVNRQAGSDMEVITSNSVVSVKGTEFGARSNGYVWVQQGEVEVTASESGEAASLTDRMFARVSMDGMDIETGELTPEELNELTSSYEVLDSELNQNLLKFRFMDNNGQIREIELDIFEPEQ